MPVISEVVKLTVRQVPQMLRALKGDDNHAVVVAKGYNEDYENYTGLTIDDYEGDTDAEILSYISEYKDFQLWITITN